MGTVSPLASGTIATDGEVTSSNDIRFARFERIRQLGRGASGIVYEAFDRETNARVALKTLRRLDPYLLVRFKNEFRALQDLRHPNLVRLGELVEEDGSWAFSMELIEGPDFLSYVTGGHRYVSDAFEAAPDPSFARAPRFDDARLRSALVQLARGLVALHDAGKVHRDIKPTNILVGPDDRLVLLDFGFVAGREGDPDLEPGWTVGTPDYMAPEQARGELPGPEADWYSVGTLLYRALTGTLPFRGDATSILQDKQYVEPTPPGRAAPDVPPDLDALCASLLAIEPEHRPTGRQVLDRLGVRRAPRASGLMEVVGGEGADLFVGRDAEIAELRARFDQMTEGASAIVSIRGESGVGKSALARRFLQSLETEVDVVTLVGHCYERESVPYKAADELVDAITRHLLGFTEARVDALVTEDAPLIARVFPVVRRLPSFARLTRQTDGAIDPVILRARLYQALRDLLRNLAESARLVVLVEDLHWADADSRALLSALMREPAPPIMLITTERAHSVQERARAEVFPTAHIIHVGALSAVEADELAARLYAQADGDVPAERRQLAGHARGHPLFIHELVRASLDTDELVDAAADLNDLVWRRVEALDVGARQIIELVAVAGEPVAQERIAHAAGIAHGDFVELVAALRAERLVRTQGVRRADAIAPFHDRVRVAVLAQLPTSLRAGCHEAIALAHEAAEHADARSLARHWLGAGRRDRAAEYAEEAARQAVELFAFDTAASLYEMALELAEPGSRDHRRLRVHLGDALANAGRSAEAATHYLAAVGARTDVPALELKRRAADQLLRAGHVERGMEVLEDVLDIVGIPMPSTSKASLAGLLLRRAHLRLRGLGFRQRDEAQIPAEELMRVDVCWSACMGVGAVDHLLTPQFQARHLLYALRAGEPRRVARAVAIETFLGAAALVRPSITDAHIAMLTELASKTDDGYAEAMATLAEAARDGFYSRWQAAAEGAEKAHAIMRDKCAGVGREMSMADQVLVVARIWLGELRELRAFIADRIRQADAIEDHYAAASLRVGILNLPLLVAGDVRAARTEVERGIEVWPSSSYYWQHYLGLVARAHIDLYAGDARAAHDSVADEWPRLERAMILRVGFARIMLQFLRGRTALAAARGESSPMARAALLRTADRAARALDKEPVPHTAGFARVLRAGAAAIDGRVADVHKHLEAALAVFDDTGTALMSALVRRVIGDRDGAEEWLRDRGVAEPDRLAAVLTPGLESS